jgi:hypothetical protein
MKKLSALFAALSIASMLTGCATVRRITAINEHPTQPVLFLETQDRLHFLGQTFRVEHVFWQCVERNGTLACQRQCGLANQDFSCPTAAAMGGGVSTNVR